MCVLHETKPFVTPVNTEVRDPIPGPKVSIPMQGKISNRSRLPDRAEVGGNSEGRRFLE